jgi:hypothetical protein
MKISNNPKRNEFKLECWFYGIDAVIFFSLCWLESVFWPDLSYGVGLSLIYVFVSMYVGVVLFVLITKRIFPRETLAEFLLVKEMRCSFFWPKAMIRWVFKS